MAVDESGTQTITYPFPLRPGLVVSVTLPADMTKHEAGRLGAFLESLALEPQLALPAGRATEE